MVRFIKNIFVSGFIFCAIILIFVSFFSQEIKSINYRFFLVQSGSMEPSIMTGDLILVKHQDDYRVNDVITFYETDKRIVTHRIASIKAEQFTTKGDANRIEDSSLVEMKNIVGKTLLVIPRAGYLVDFSKTLNGFVIFIVLPSAILIFSQLLHFGK